jgi:uncharacterized protein DUF1344
MRHFAVILVALGLAGADAGAQVMVAPLTQVALSDSGVPQAKEIQGRIKALDRANKTVTLEDGTTLTIPKAVKVTPTALQKGAMVTANYEVQDGQRVIITLEVWPPSKF